MVFGTSYTDAGSGMAGLAGWYDDWGKDLLGKGFDFGTTFVKSKYAKDASKYTGSYYPQGQTESTPRYAPITTGGNTLPNSNSTISNTAGSFAASFTRFVEENLGVLAIGGVFLLAFMRTPGGRR